MSIGKSQIAEIAESFAHSAAYEFRGSSALYEKLSTGIGADPELLGLASHAISKPVPMIFLAAIHYLLLNDAYHPLAAYYRDINPDPCSAGVDLYPVFRDFCLRHRADIKDIITTRHVQTNEVRRCACLLPAFGVVALDAGEAPFTLVEIGASAGLNLLWDHYGYGYGNGRFYGNRTSTVKLTCDLRGNLLPPFPETFPRVASRLGIDLHPIDVRDESEACWLRSFIWPEHTARFDLLQRAIGVARDNPPELQGGDAFDLLPDVLSAAPPDTVLCLFHTFVSNQMSPEMRSDFADIIADYGAKRDIYCISIDLMGKYPKLQLISYKDGVGSHRRLADCSGHSRWIEWFDKEV